MKKKIFKFLKRYVENSKDPLVIAILILTIFSTILVLTGVATFMEVEYPLLIILSIVPTLILTIMDFKYGYVE